MRKIGATTIKIDEAIQKLFEFGEIQVPTKGHLEKINNDPQFMRGRSKNYGQNFIIDPDWYMGFAQQDLFNRIVRRLNGEHEGQFTIESGYIIKLKND